MIKYEREVLPKQDCTQGGGAGAAVSLQTDAQNFHGVKLIYVIVKVNWRAETDLPTG